ncbi:hypothetical protein [Streptomyces sp. NBC_00344]|uniref:hypothetical protein n=1 Tax=Streptomyces sp. NBC_00344 TaxID=2975720 RepID=UPI002E21FE99
MGREFEDVVSPYSERNVITSVQDLMRADGVAVTLSAIARRSGTSRNFLYRWWRSPEALRQLAVTAEVMTVFDTAEHACPSRGTISGTVAHLVHVARGIRSHPTTAAIARTSPASMAGALTAMDGPLPDAVCHRLRQILHSLRLADAVREREAVDALAWKILWIARPAALCPQALGDKDRERTLDLGLGLLLSDLLTAAARAAVEPQPVEPQPVEPQPVEPQPGEV